MGIAWGILVALLSLLCWGGQAISWLAPNTGVRLGLMEAEDTVDPAFFADGRGEARWDTFTLWTMVVAGVLLVMDDPTWAYFGLIGGGMYLYFAGRGLIVRRVMDRHDIPIGKPETMKLYNAILIVWGLIAVVTIIMAVAALPLQ